MRTYTIKEVSEMFSLPASTLRYYEDMGILPPVERTPTNQRIYTQEHVDRLGTIGCFKGTGMSIAQLQAFFNYEADEAGHIDDILKLLESQEARVAASFAKLQKDYAHIQRKLRYYKAIKTAIENHQPRPDWDDFKNDGDELQP